MAMNNNFDSQQQLIEEWGRRSEEFARSYFSVAQLSVQDSQADLLQETDALAATYFPLPKHYAVQCDAHTREAYATMLAAMALKNGALSASQSRLLGMLLDALDLPGAQTRVLAQVPQLQREALGEFLRLAKAAKLAESFLLDAMILCRMEGPLTAEQNQLLSEMADFLEIDTDQLLVLSFWAARVLGLSFDYSLLSKLEMAHIDVGRQFDEIGENYTVSDCKVICTKGDFVLNGTGIFSAKLTRPYFSYFAARDDGVVEFIFSTKTGVIYSMPENIETIDGKVKFNGKLIAIIVFPEFASIWIDSVINAVPADKLE
jgi:hypothetical protein